ncbi:MAG: phospholipase D-like domain-containing protein [bacterium]
MKFGQISLAVLALTFAACVSDDTSSPDGEFDVAFAGGKADSMIGECETNALLGKLNNPETSAEGLKDAGIHTRAANNIIAQRNGLDALPGTEDDFYFRSLTDVDDVSYVGTVAMSQLLEMVAGTCIVTGGNAEVIFSPQPYETSHLARVAELIDGAQHSIDIAMYSYSDSKIGAALRRAVERGIDVRFIFETANEDKSSPAGTKSAALEDMGIDVRYVSKIMHHKFVIIDGPRDMNAFQNQTRCRHLGHGLGQLVEQRRHALRRKHPVHVRQQRAEPALPARVQPLVGQQPRLLVEPRDRVLPRATPSTPKTSSTTRPSTRCSPRPTSRSRNPHATAQRLRRMPAGTRWPIDLSN